MCRLRFPNGPKHPVRFLYHAVRRQYRIRFLHPIRSGVAGGEYHTRQTVAIKDTDNNPTYSDWKLVKHGVPQGSILCPLFYLSYVDEEAKGSGV